MAAKIFEPKKILIPTDFSETSNLAIEHGAFMAKLCRADIIMLHVLEHTYESFNIVAPEIKLEMPGNIEERIMDKLREVGEKIRKDYGVSSEVISTSGNICHEVVSAAKEEQCDMIVMGTHGVSGFEEFFMGSNSYKAVTKSTVPVLTVQSHAKRIGFTEILLPIDNSDHSRQKVNHAAAIAKRYGSRIHVLGLLDEDDAEDLNKFQIKIDNVCEYLQKCEIPYTQKVEVAYNQARSTLKFAREIAADIIIIMTDQEESHTGLFIGPYAQQVVNHSWIPVLSIQPVEHPENIPWIHPY